MTFQSTKKQAADLSKVIAKQVMLEPLEVIKTAGKQVTGVEGLHSSSPPDLSAQTPRASRAQIEVLEAKDKAESDMKYQSLKQNLESEIQKARAQRVTPAVEVDQKSRSKPLVEPITKRSRNPLKGMARKLSDLGKRAEIRMPPSG